MAKNWGSEPDLRAEIKRDIAAELGQQLRVRGLIAFRLETEDNGDTTIVGSIRQGATAEEVSAAYRAKARTAHPDAGGSQAAMSELNRARDEALRHAH